MRAGNALALERKRDDAAGEALAEAGDGVKRARSEIPDRAEAFDDFAEIAEMIGEDGL